MKAKALATMTALVALAMFAAPTLLSGDEIKPKSVTAKFDPTPVESEAGPALGTTPAEAAEVPSQVKKLRRREKPFAGLRTPTVKDLPEEDPRGDTLRLGPKAPPEPGEVVEEFPTRFPEAARPVVKAKPLEISRYTPKENIDLVERITVSFNQPMVPLAQLPEIDATAPPFTVEPRVDGRFLWLGTDTVALEAAKRLPFATTYTVSVPAGIKSALGQTLAKELAWTFETPRPTITSFSPGNGSNGMPLEFDLYLRFTTVVDPAAILKWMEFKDERGRKIELIPQGNGPQDAKGIRTLVNATNVTYRPAEKLKPGTDYTLTVAKGLLSVEGPLPAVHSHSFTMRTYDPLRIVSIQCYWEGECNPGQPINVQFNNELAEDQDVTKLISVTPKPADLKIQRNWGQVTISGSFLPNSTVTVTAKRGFRDAYGQVSKKGKTKKLRFRPLPSFLSFGEDGMRVIEAHQNHNWTVISFNVKGARLRMAPVPENKLREVHGRAGSYFEKDEDPLEGLRVTVDRNLKMNRKKNAVNFTSFTMDKCLNKEGFGLAFVDFQASIKDEYGERYHERYTALVQVTDLGLTIAESGDEGVVRVTSLKSGQPVEGVAVKLVDHEWTTLSEAVTGANGVARLPGPAVNRGKGSSYFLVATKGPDLAFQYYNQTVSSRPDRNPNATPASVGYVFTERGLYRPGEEVSITVLSRLRELGPNGDLKGVPEAGRTFEYQVSDSRGQEIAKGEVKLSDWGVGTFSVKTAKEASLGYYSISLRNDWQSLYLSFQVEEYRVPEFRVDTQWLHGGSNVLIWRKLEALVTAAYFFGAPMAGAEVSWSVVRSDSYFAPPGNPGFSFRDIHQVDFWRGRHHHRGYWGPHVESVANGTGKLDADGKLAVPVTLEPGGFNLGAVTFTLEANVVDENRQAIAGRTSITAHRAERYVGLTVDRSVIEAGESVGASAIVTRLDGTRYDEAEIDVRLVRAFNKEVPVNDNPGQPEMMEQYTEEEVGSCTLTSGQAAATCRLTAPEAGIYLLRAATKDLAGRPTRTAVQIMVYGPGQSWWRPDPNNRIELLFDKAQYEPGDTATIMVQSPFKEAFGLAVTAREGIVQVDPLDVENGVAAFKVKVQENWIPGIRVDVILATGRVLEPGDSTDDPGRPRFANVSGVIKVDAARRQTNLKITPSAPAVAPGEILTVDIEATDYAGNPVETNITLAVVDEGVLSLIGFITPNPLAALYQVVSTWTYLHDLRSVLMPRTRPDFDISAMSGAGAGVAQMMMESISGPMNGGRRSKMAPSKKASKSKSPGGDDGGDFAVRELFKSTAYFKADLKTGKDGKLTVPIKMPDNTTEFRVMAIAADKARLFGSGQIQVQTRQTLILQAALPRFLNYGDEFEAAVVVNNQTGFDTEVVVRCAASNAVIDDAQQQIPIKAGDAVEVRFPAKAGNPGPATFQFAAVALTKRRDRDAVELTIPTLIPATSEAFATYGVVTDAIQQPLSPPKDVLPGFGGLDVWMSSTALTGLQDAASYLFEYQFECTEQLCSRILPIIALKDVLKDFGIGGLETVEEQDTLVKRGIKKLLTRQRSDGGFGYWSGSSTSWLYLSAYATMTLDWARQRGYDVPENVIYRSRYFLQDRLNNPHDWEEHAYGAQAMAALVLVRLGEKPTKHLERLYKIATEDRAGKEPGQDYPMTIYARAWLMEALARVAEKRTEQVEKLYQQIENSVVETTSAVHYAEGKSEHLKLMMHTAERTDAIVLGSLLAVNDESPLIEKTVRGLIRSRVNGRWSTTQANAYALISLSEYYRKFEADEPDFEARLWFEDDYLTGRKFKGREMTIAKTRVPMKKLLKEAAGNLVLAKEGTGRLYYRLGLKYAPKNLRLEQYDRGFQVDRVYLPVGDDSVVEQRKDGTWVAKAGSYILVKVRMIAPDRRYFVALVDPMPAGVEAVNERFLTSLSTAGAGSNRGYWGWRWWSPWDHTEKRDDRVQVFADRVYSGVYEYSYVTRATTIGTFVVPPARAEEMYTPETFGRTGTDLFVVVP